MLVGMIDDSIRIVLHNTFLGRSIMEQAVLHLAVIINPTGCQEGMLGFAAPSN
jgi:hypothetical protein